MKRNAYMLRAGAALLVILVVMAGLLYWQARQIVTTHVADQLDVTRTAQGLVEHQHSTDIGTRAKLIVGNQAFVGYVTQAMGGALPGMQEVDVTSIVDLLEERREQLDLEVIAILDGQGRMVAGTSGLSGRRVFGAEPLFVEARDNGIIRDGLWLDDDRLMHIAILPLTESDFNESFLLVGMPVGRELAGEVAGVGEAEVALLAIGAQEQSIVASTLSPGEAEALATALPLADETRVRTLVLAGKKYRVDSSPLFGSADGRLLMLARADADPVSLLPMLLGAVLVLVAAVLALAWYWTRVEAPATRLADIMARASRGDHNLQAVEQGSSGMKRIANVFNRLMHDVSDADSR